VFEANVRATVKALFRKGDPAGKGKPSRTAFVRRDGGWFGGRPAAPDLPLDVDVLSETELDTYVAALTRNGFHGPGSWYMNHEANRLYQEKSLHAGRLDMPVLFLHGQYDYTCATIEGRFADPMRGSCTDLTETVVRTGHWMAQEDPISVNAALARWIALKLPSVWHGLGELE
jgi:pimeloyl-ACP methyl ester carboxylesterase